MLSSITYIQSFWLDIVLSAEFESNPELCLWLVCCVAGIWKVKMLPCVFAPPRLQDLVILSLSVGSRHLFLFGVIFDSRAAYGIGKCDAVWEDVKCKFVMSKMTQMTKLYIANMIDVC